MLIWLRNKLKASNNKIKGTGMKFYSEKRGGGFWCGVNNKGTGLKSSEEWDFTMPEEEVCSTVDEAENYVSVYDPLFQKTLILTFIADYRIIQVHKIAKFA